MSLSEPHQNLHHLHQTPPNSEGGEEENQRKEGDLFEEKEGGANKGG